MQNNGLVKRGFFSKVKKYRVLLLMLLPAVIYTIIFCYLPMSGIILAFKDFNYRDGIFGSPFSGFENFEFFFQSGQALKVTKNTVLYNLVFIVMNTFFQLTVAILLTEVKSQRFKKTAHSFMFLPYFISWVVVSSICYDLLSPDYGLVNRFFVFLGLEKVDFYNNSFFWPFILVFFNVWKNIGYGSVMYLAAITGIDTSLYEAAEIDGANVFQRIFRITIPALRPTLIVLTLLALGGVFKGNFEMFYNLVGSNGLLYDTTDVIDTFTFRALMQSNDFGMSAASAFYQSILCFVTILIANFAVKKYDRDYSLF
ncbi:MAG: sugar ABC transporter permease [Lachnospiraceae bacterium]|nr:sugar ABC transporter permease [Lachnospiraceae bacterium]